MFKISNAHLPVKCESTFLTGQCSIFEYFFKFSCSVNVLIIKNRYLKVTYSLFSKLLYKKIICPTFAVSKRKRISAAKLLIYPNYNT